MGNLYKLNITNVFEKGSEYCSRCERSSGCAGALVTLEYKNVRSEFCLSTVPRNVLIDKMDSNQPIFIDGAGRVVLDGAWNENAF